MTGLCLQSKASPASFKPLQVYSNLYLQAFFYFFFYRKYIFFHTKSSEYGLLSRNSSQFLPISHPNLIHTPICLSLENQQTYED